MQSEKVRALKMKDIYELLLTSRSDSAEGNPLFNSDMIYQMNYEEILEEQEVHLLAIFAIIEDQKHVFEMVRDFVLKNHIDKTGSFRQALGKDVD
jgi:hypothetical protein